MVKEIIQAGMRTTTDTRAMHWVNVELHCLYKSQPLVNNSFLMHISCNSYISWLAVGLLGFYYVQFNIWYSRFFL